MKFSKFTVDIELGNFAMRTRSDVADAMFYIVETLRHEPSVVGGRITDCNGNNVGTWELVK